MNVDIDRSFEFWIVFHYLNLKVRQGLALSLGWMSVITLLLTPNAFNECRTDARIGCHVVGSVPIKRRYFLSTSIEIYLNFIGYDRIGIIIVIDRA